MAIALALQAACSDAARDPAPTEAKPSEPTPPDPSEDAVWSYLPTLRQHAPADISMFPVMEIEEPNQARVELVVAAGRAHGPTLERWRFQAQPPDSMVAPVSDPVPVARIRSQDPGPAGRAELLSRMAAPGNTVRRVQGLTPKAEQLLSRLVALAIAVRDPKGSPTSRARALAELLQGVDDRIVFRSSRLPALIDLLATSPAPGATVAEGTRRARTETAGHRFSLTRKSDGWVVSDLEAIPSAREP
jgi:hypothetical protein